MEGKIIITFGYKYFTGPPVPSNDEVETITFDEPHSGKVNEM